MTILSVHHARDERAWHDDSGVRRCVPHRDDRARTAVACIAGSVVLHVTPMRELDSTLMRADLRDREYASPKDGLATRKLAPGEKLRLQELAKTYGVSRNPVQQALTRLVSPRGSSRSSRISATS
jgi:hypothetical protein